MARTYVLAFEGSPQPGEPMAEVDLRLLYTQRDDLALIEPRLDALAGVRPWPADEAVAHLHAIRGVVAGAPKGPRGRELFAPDDVRARLVEQLVAACDAIASDGRPVRLDEVTRPIPVDQQLAALAAAGIVTREPVAREVLVASWGEDEMAEHPWELLHDFIERSDLIVDLALKAIETSDDRDAYERVARRFARLARGRLPLEQIESAAVVGAGGYLEFVLDGEPHRLQAEDNGEWLDTGVLGGLDRLLRARSEGWGFYAFEGAGESMTTICCDRDGYLRLRAAGAPLIPLGR